MAKELVDKMGFFDKSGSVNKSGSDKSDDALYLILYHRKLTFESMVSFYRLPGVSSKANACLYGNQSVRQKTE